MLRSYPRCFYASIMPCAQQKLTARVVFIHHLVPCPSVISTKLTPHRMSISRFDAERAELINISQDRKYEPSHRFASLRITARRFGWHSAGCHDIHKEPHHLVYSVFPLSSLVLTRNTSHVFYESLLRSIIYCWLGGFCQWRLVGDCNTTISSPKLMQLSRHYCLWHQLLLERC